VARHRSKDVTLYRQGDINFIVNAEPDSHGQPSPASTARAPAPWPSASPMPRQALQARCRTRRQAGRQIFVGPMELRHPGDRRHRRQPDLYLVDRYGAKGSIYDVDFEWLGRRKIPPEGAGLTYLDHLTHNVHRGRMDVGRLLRGSSTSARSAISTSRAS
jgi:4-hydroxyphenylpyruvate dioxygenase